ncbi:hypothetical protein AKJ64_01370 [candidate division MSBL1 archaeon SCGC-AAA259E17]|uniref:C2H2-type domain-containing protein n=1 Tax=candidate division MSBL1 archaeon SCGC-AAA259E17 TaxID=1698263 RepID=A0A133UFZ1_9EURY|nr:hypothetical protein AKJ64_01370 [candidate division MSBL1 archaeon SCGC-AAA259E17]
MSGKVNWLKDGKPWGISAAVYPSYKNWKLSPFDWTLLKRADPPTGPPAEHLPLSKLVSKASERLIGQMAVLDESDYLWYGPELEWAEDRAERLLREHGLLFEKAPPAKVKGTPYKKWVCPKCGENFRRGCDLKNHLTDRRTHDMDLGPATRHVQKVREQRQEDYKKAAARVKLVEDHLVPDLNAGALAGGSDHKDWIKGFAERSKRTSFADWIHRGGKKKIFKNGPPDVVRVKPTLDPEGYFEADGLELERVDVQSIRWLVGKPFNVEFIAPPANKKREQIEKALKRARERTLILVTEDSPKFVEEVVEEESTGRVEKIPPNVDPATNLRLYRE